MGRDWGRGRNAVPKCVEGSSSSAMKLSVPRIWNLRGTIVDVNLMMAVRSIRQVGNRDEMI